MQDRGAFTVHADTQSAKGVALLTVAKTSPVKIIHAQISVKMYKHQLNSETRCCAMEDGKHPHSQQVLDTHTHTHIHRST